MEPSVYPKSPILTKTAKNKVLGMRGVFMGPLYIPAEN